MDNWYLSDHDVIEDERFLSKVEDIQPYFEENYYDHFDCGQGYYDDEVTKLIKIGDKFYQVRLTADIGSAKQEYGDRLYWVDGLSSVSWMEIQPPTEPTQRYIHLEVCMDENKVERFKKYMESNGIKLTYFASFDNEETIGH
jgi:hypothetical protein